MPPSVRTRKSLWARSGNCCVLCRIELITAEFGSVPDVIVGEECHIVSAKKNGPRGNEELVEDLDGYDNLILLCANDHTRNICIGYVGSTSLVLWIRVLWYEWTLHGCD